MVDAMAKYLCGVCRVYEYDVSRGDPDTDVAPGTEPADFPSDWRCPICQSDKTCLERIEDELSPQPASEAEASTVRTVAADQDHGARIPTAGDAGAWDRESDDFEIHMADIRQMSITGQSASEPMRTTQQVASWGDLLIKGAQLAKIPMDKDTPVSSETTIGRGAEQPLVIDMPVYVTHMSFGALSREAKIALAKGTAAVKTAVCSGEGGILSECFENAHRYIFEYVPNRYSVTDETLKRVDAVEIKIGQSAKPGLGGHLPAEKVTRQVAEVRGLPEGADIDSPAYFPDIRSRDELKEKVDWLRETSGGKPIGIKMAAGNIEADMEVAVHARPDFITIDGRPGATASAPRFVKDATSIPTVFALPRARPFLDERGVKDISLVVTGGLRISSDFAKALALGADAVAIGTAALIACGCRQYRLCHTGNCPTGIATQDPNLTARLDVHAAAKRLENFLRVSREEIETFARLTGNNDVHAMSVDDLCTTNSELSNHTPIEHA